MRSRLRAPAEGKPLAVTMGDPAGIGPDIAILAWRDRLQRNLPAFFVAGDPAIFNARARLLWGEGLVPVRVIKRPEDAKAVFARALPVLPLSQPLPAVTPGHATVEHAAATIESIEAATALAATGRAAAVVTNPIAKYTLMQAGFAHAGHTEFLAELAARHGAPGATPVMMMASERMRAIPVTVHTPLKDVPSAITQDRIVTVARIADAALKRFFGVAAPRLAVCGLNPHAGESGALGREEIDIIAPAIEALKAEGILASGPHSADTLFHDAALERHDAVLAMYHDQALIPFKTLSFDDGVNVTLGLPFIRTSPDHGTAFSLAGTGLASATSFIEALRLAHAMANAAAQPAL
jgi:4-hydroxythreonine-4-phosphate dehydrogenase